jgi:hypothetical protein
MARTRILLDSNSYFRLAKSIHPLLDQEFGGDTRYCLYVIPDLDDEFEKNPRLRRKFHWVNEPEYRANRARALPYSRPQRREISQAYDFILNHARTEGLAVSPVDVRALAMAYVLQVQVVTDDQEMLLLAEEFGIRTLKTLALMQLMLNCGHIDLDRVRQIATYWQYDKDTPAEFRKDYQRLFGEQAPPLL